MSCGNCSQQCPITYCVQGPPGQAGSTGNTGATGDTGQRGSVIYCGPLSGINPPPGSISATYGDVFINTDNGDLWWFNMGWSLTMNIKGPTGNTGQRGNTGNTGSTGNTGLVTSGYVSDLNLSSVNDSFSINRTLFTYNPVGQQNIIATFSFSFTYTTNSNQQLRLRLIADSVSNILLNELFLELPSSSGISVTKFINMTLTGTFSPVFPTYSIRARININGVHPGDTYSITNNYGTYGISALVLK